MPTRRNELLGAGALAVTAGLAVTAWAAYAADGSPGAAPSRQPSSQIAFMTLPPRAALEKGAWHTALHVMNADGSGKRTLTRKAWNVEAPAWSPDGRRLAFERRAGPLTNGQCACDIDVFVMNADGSGQQNLTRHPVLDTHPVWSPDGQKLAFVRYRDVWVVDADGSGQRRLTLNREGDRSPAWSPDGKRIAFVSFHGRNWEVHVMNADGSGHRNLTRNRAQDYGPTWSPNGRKIAFVRTRNSSRLHGYDWELYVMNADGSGQRKLARTAPQLVAPAWSPDGRKLLFVSNRTGNPEIYVIGADGSGQRRLTRNPAIDSAPAWSPDGRTIGFVSTRAGRPAIYVMNADGSRPRNLTRGVRRLGIGFAWSPRLKTSQGEKMRGAK
jgi:Tol biopolymer transport system component